MKTVDPNEVAVKMKIVAGGQLYPAFPSEPRATGTGTPYLTSPGVVLLEKPAVDLSGLRYFLQGFDPELDFMQYLDDDATNPVDGDGTRLVKALGQLCYMSFGPNRLKNADAQKYINNILSSGHGSVVEHAGNYNFLIWGVGRDFTHELVRHRTGVGFSQVSQRYVDGKVLRFVERPEYQADEELHSMFETRVDRIAADYADVAEHLLRRQAAGAAELTGEKRTEMRKKVNQAARSLLPNETEAPIGFSGNARALRHVIEMRSSGAADVPIRLVTTRIFLTMRLLEPKLFNDYKLYELADGTHAVATDWRKV